MRSRFFSAAFTVVVIASCALAEDAQSNSKQASTTCDFNNQSQLTLNYQAISINPKDKKYLGDDVPYGKVWEPGKKAMTLFTTTPVTLAGKQIPTGAYTLYLVPQEQKWTLVVSKNTDVNAKYDKSKDLVRAPMETGQLLSRESQFSVYFAHTGPQECTMRVDVADTRAWVPFEQK